MEDLAFSAGYSKNLFSKKLVQIIFPQRLIDANLDPDASGTFHYATMFHQFIISIITNRPIHCHGVLPKRAQRILWSYIYQDSSPIHLIHVCNNHYIGLLPKLRALDYNKYTYYCLFMNEDENNQYKNRPYNPLNEIPFTSDQSVINLE